MLACFVVLDEYLLFFHLLLLRSMPLQYFITGMVGTHAIGVLRRQWDSQCYFVSFCLPSLHKAQPLSLWIYFLSQKEKFTYAGITNEFVVINTAIKIPVPTAITRCPPSTVEDKSSSRRKLSISVNSS